MAQSITTLLDKTEITAAQIAAATSVINYLYLVHGTGSGRSRKISLDELKKAIGALNFESLVVGDGNNYVQIANTKIKFNKSTNSFEISLTTETVDNVTIPLMHVNSKIQSALGFKGRLEGDVTGDLNGDVVGDVTGDLTGDSTGTHNGDVSTNSITARIDTSPINIGNSTQGAQFNGRLVAGSAVAGAIQGTNLVVRDSLLVPDSQYPLDLKQGPIIKITSIADSSKVWLITSFKDVIVGQRFTIVNATENEELKIMYGRTGKVAVIPPKSACDFIVLSVQLVGTAPNTYWSDTLAVVGGCEIDNWT